MRDTMRFNIKLKNKDFFILNALLYQSRHTKANQIKHPYKIFSHCLDKETCILVFHNSKNEIRSPAHTFNHYST